MRPEHPRVHGIHLAKLAHVDKKDTASQHVLKVRPRGAQDILDVPQATFRLGLDTLRHLARDWIPGALPRDEYQFFETDRG